jgi:two-component system, sensor histidine kinase
VQKYVPHPSARAARAPFPGAWLLCALAFLPGCAGSTALSSAHPLFALLLTLALTLALIGLILVLRRARTRAHAQEMTFRRKDGSLVPVESTSSLGEHGGVECTLGIIRDITQRKAAEESLARQAVVAGKDEAGPSSRAKSDFLDNMTHEVRTPLNGILGMLQVLQGTGLTPEQQDYVGVALESAERLNLLLGNVIEFARLDEAATEAECLLFPPTDLLHSLEAEFAPRARAKGLALSVDHAPGLPELIRSDPQVLRQILSKILDNALKFTPAGKISLEAFCPEGDPAQLHFRVSDQGIGIPEDKRQHIFDAFVQGDASITRTFGGAGLGLAIARRLAARLGGSLGAQDREGGGTVMLLTIQTDCPGRLAS